MLAERFKVSFTTSHQRAMRVDSAVDLSSAHSDSGVRIVFFCINCIFFKELFVLSSSDRNEKIAGDKNKIASHIYVVLYFHFFIILFLMVFFCSDTTPPSHTLSCETF